MVVIVSTLSPFGISISASAQRAELRAIHGRWVNTQYEYFKGRRGENSLVHRISPWYIDVDSFGKCSVELQFEHHYGPGYPVDIKTFGIETAFRYRTNHPTWLHIIAGNDSVLIYSNGVTPGAGVIFRRVH